MPVAGRKAPPEGKPVRHRVKPVHEWTVIPNVAYDGHPLPDSRPDGRPWPQWTRDWWQVISTMPHCTLWSDADWRFAIETALVAGDLHDGKIDKAAELRMREKVMGTTVDFRRDLRIRYVDPAADEPEQVTRLDDYRDL